MEFILTKDQYWLNKWDSFLQNTNRGLYIQLSDWIKSYTVYGFDYDFLIVVNNNEIVGGCGIVYAKISIFKFQIIPCGPVIEVGYEDVLDEIISKILQIAKNTKCCCSQISLPFCENNQNFNDYSLNCLDQKSVYLTGKEGVKFKYVIPLKGYRLLDLKNKEQEQIINNYSSNHKRNLIKAKKNILTFKFVNSKELIKKAYSCFELNSVDKGYPLRSFISIEKTLNNLVEKNIAKIGCCYYNDTIVGAIYVIKSGNRLTYINGGVLKEYQNLNISMYMHDEMIKYSINKKYDSYDFSVGGSQGVVRFKKGFGTKLFTFVPTRYWIFMPKTFKAYEFTEKYLRKYKTKIAKILVYLKNK